MIALAILPVAFFLLAFLVQKCIDASAQRGSQSRSRASGGPVQSGPASAAPESASLLVGRLGRRSISNRYWE